MVMGQVRGTAGTQEDSSVRPVIPNSSAALAAPKSLPDLLTTREASVLTMIAEGLTNREVGAVLGISVRTVEFHRLNLMRKAKAKNFADLMRILFGYPRSGNVISDLTRRK
jgi:DNA-binding CsgD family transcriptional regulator